MKIQNHSRSLAMSLLLTIAGSSQAAITDNQGSVTKLSGSTGSETVLVNKLLSVPDPATANSQVNVALNNVDRLIAISTNDLSVSNSHSLLVNAHTTTVSDSQHSTISGSTQNVKNVTNSIVGGGENTLTNVQTSVVAGLGNTITGEDIEEKGGRHLVVGWLNELSQSYNNVVGGAGNYLSKGANENLVGGWHNEINSRNSMVVGEGNLVGTADEVDENGALVNKNNIVGGNANDIPFAESSIISGTENIVSQGKVEDTLILGKKTNIQLTTTSQKVQTSIISGTGFTSTGNRIQDSIISGNGNTHTGGVIDSSLILGVGNAVKTAEQSVISGKGNDVSAFKSGVFGTDNTAEMAVNTLISGSGNFVRNVPNSSEAKVSTNSAAAIGTGNTIGKTVNGNNVPLNSGYAIGNNNTVSVDGGVAIGNNAVADRTKGSTGWDVLDTYTPTDGFTSTVDDKIKTSTQAAIAVGDGDKNLAQIIGVAAGTEDTDAANVGQVRKVAEALGHDLNAVKDDLKEVQGNVEALDTDVSKLKTDVAANTKAIADLEPQVTANTKDIADLKPQVATNTQDIATLKTDVEELDKAVSDLNGRVSGIEDKAIYTIKSNSDYLTVNREGNDVTLDLTINPEDFITSLTSDDDRLKIEKVEGTDGTASGYKLSLDGVAKQSDLDTLTSDVDALDKQVAAMDKTLQETKGIAGTAKDTADQAVKDAADAMAEAKIKTTVKSNDERIKIIKDADDENSYTFELNNVVSETDYLADQKRQDDEISALNKQSNDNAKNIETNRIEIIKANDRITTNEKAIEKNTQTLEKHQAVLDDHEVRITTNRKDIDALKQNVGHAHQRIDNIEDKVNKNRKEARKGIAVAGAIGMLPQATMNGYSMVSAATTHYRGEQAVAVGYSRLSDNGQHIIKLSGSGTLTGKKEGMVGAAYGFQW